MINDDLTILLSLDKDDLYSSLGNEILGISIGTTPQPKENLISLAKAWLESKRSQLSETICNSASVIALISKETEDVAQRRLMLASAIVDLIAQIIHGLSVTTVAALIVIEGLETFC